MTSRLRVEFHCHTSASRDCLTSPAQLVRACRRKAIDRLVITDHNTLRGAIKAQEIDPQLVIIGEEIMTDKGELLAAFVHEEIPRGLPVLEAIERLRAQDAFISVSHPFDRNRRGSWNPADLEAIVPFIDAVETFNARCLLASFNASALEFARLHDLPGTVGSDAHTAFEVGQAILLLDPFQDARGLKQSIRSARSICKKSHPLVRLTSRFAALIHAVFPDRNSP